MVRKLYRFTWKGKVWYTYYTDFQLKVLLRLFAYLREKQKPVLKSKLMSEAKVSPSLLMDCIAQGFVNMKPVIISNYNRYAARAPVLKLISLNKTGQERFYKELEESIYFVEHKAEILAQRKSAHEKFYESSLSEAMKKLQDEGDEKDDYEDDEDVEPVPEKP